MGTSNRIGRIAALALPLVPALTIASYWILSLGAGESLSVAATYRYGDYNYFPPLAGLAHFKMGEWLVFEHLGEGLRSFPFPSLVLHGVSLGLLGPVGFMVADVAVAVAVYFAAQRLFRACRLSSSTVAILTLVVSCGLLAWPGAHLQRWLEWAPNIHLWGLRFPRPFLTDLFLLLCIGSWLRILVGHHERQREWALLGFWFGLLLQSRYYSATTVGLAVGLGALPAMLRPGGMVRSLRGLGIFAGVAAVTCLPFVAQRLFEHPDVPARFGAFAVDRLDPRFPEDLARRLVPSTLFAAAAALLVYWAALPRRRERLGATLALAVLWLLSLLALPASTVLLGQTIQPYHFLGEAVTFRTLVILVSLGQMLDAGAASIARHLPSRDWGLWLRRSGIAVVAASCLLLGTDLHLPRIAFQDHVRATYKAYRAPGYRTAFRELTDELGRERYAGARVLGTLDIQVLDWWALFGGMHAFSPEPCATSIDDDEIEDRLLRFLRELGANERDFRRIIRDRAVIIFFLGCAKYQVSRGHHFAPLSDYPRNVQQIFLKSTLFSSWRIALPNSEAKRLAERYARTREGRGDLRLDVIVLGPSRLDHGLAPAPEQFRLNFENSLFRVYLRADLEPEGGET